MLERHRRVSNARRSGEVLVDGRPVTGPGPDRAVLFQEPALFPWLSVRGNLDLALRLADVPPDEREERAATWLTRVEVDRSADRQPHELSAGMRQRAALARALACDPPILLGDEPFGALDALARERLQDIVQRVRVERAGRTTFVFATHNVREAVLLADRVLVMSAAPGTAPRGVPDRRAPAPDARRRPDRPRRLGDPRPPDRSGRGGLAVKRWASELGPPLLGVAVLLVVWAVVAAVTDTSSIPGPAEVWTALRDGFADGSIPEATVKSLIRLAFSFAAALVIGTALGLAARGVRARAPEHPSARRRAPDHAVRRLGAARRDLVRRHRARRRLRRDRGFVPRRHARHAAGDPPGPAAVRAGRADPRRDGLGRSSGRSCSPRRSPPTWRASSRRGGSRGRR